MNYTVTANTVIEFDFSSSSEGEIHGVGFEDDNTLTSTRYFKVHGTQNYGVTNFDDYAGGTKTYTIPVGNFYQGSMDRLVFINDDDSGAGNTSTFANVKIYEGSCSASLNKNVIANFEGVTAILGDEPEGIASSVQIWSNITTDKFTISVDRNLTDIKATLYSVIGNRTQGLDLSAGTSTFSAKNLHLSSGMYLIRIEHAGDTTIKKLIVN